MTFRGKIRVQSYDTYSKMSNFNQKIKKYAKKENSQYKLSLNISRCGN